MNRTKLFDRVIEAWGETAQLDMLQEECAELIQAISKWNKACIDEGDMVFADGDEPRPVLQRNPTLNDKGEK